MSTDKIVQEIYGDTIRMLDDGFQYEDFVVTLGIIMRICQLREDLRGRGPQKKEIAISVFKLFATESGLLTAAQAQAASTFLLVTVPSLIDTLKSISKDIAEAAAGSKKWRCCC